MRSAALVLGLVLAACNGKEQPSPKPKPPPQAGKRDDEARSLLARIAEPDVFLRLVELGRAEPLIEATAKDRDSEVRHLAAVALGKIGGPAARDRLLELLEERNEKDQGAEGWMHLYAAVGLTELADPGTAIRLILNLSEVNPNDSIAARAHQTRSEEYFTIDAQLCEALLRMGLCELEESLVAQLRRKDRIRVGIDAHAALRRSTGLDLPFRYNGSFRTREADADGWLEELRKTREQRRAANPFHAKNAEFRKDMERMLSWLRGTSVRSQLTSKNVLRYLGPVAVPFLIEELSGEGAIGRRHSAWVLGRLKDVRAAEPLMKLLADEDDESRAQGVDALRRLHHKAAAKHVRKLLDDPDPKVRAQAVLFLVQTGETSVQESLADKAVLDSIAHLYVHGALADREVARSALATVLGPSRPEAADAMETRRKAVGR